MSTARHNPPNNPLSALQRVTGSQNHNTTRSHQSKMHELDAKIVEVKTQIDVLNDELKLLSKERELEKHREILREKTSQVEKQREEVERMKEAHRLFEEEGRRKSAKREAEAFEEAACRKRKRTEDGVVKIEID